MVPFGWILCMKVGFLVMKEAQKNVFGLTLEIWNPFKTDHFVGIDHCASKIPTNDIQLYIPFGLGSSILVKMDPYISKGWAVISQHLVHLLYFCLRFINLNGKMSSPFLVASCILSLSVSVSYFPITMLSLVIRYTSSK